MTMIEIIDNLVPPDLCEEICQRFQEQQRWVRHEPGWMDHLAMYTQRDSLGLTESYDWQRETDQLHSLLTGAYLQYKQRWDPYDQLPLTDFLVEQFRCKRYQQGQQKFDLHSDGSTARQSQRFLGFLIYLRDSDAGTEFPQQDLMIEARQGRCVVFPPLWAWPHRGLCPQFADKYIVSAYYCWK